MGRPQNQKTMKNKPTTYARFYALLGRMAGDREQVKEMLVSRFTEGRKSSLPNMKASEYDAMCVAMEAEIKHPGMSEDEYRRDLVVWTEYLVRFKTFFDDYHAGKAGVKEIRQFRQWALENCYGKRILRFASFNRYTQNIEQMISEGKKWLHFGLDWEDAYVVKHSQTILK